MHKAKKAINELRAYLGRDAHGLSLLEGVARIVNELRKDVAKANEDAESLRSEISPTSNARAAAELRSKSLECELDILRAKIKQKDRELESANAEVSDLRNRIDSMVEDMEAPEFSQEDRKVLGKIEEEESFPDGLMDVRSLVAMFNALRREMPKSPRIHKGKRAETPVTYFIDEIISDYSTLEMIKLGRIVASSSMFTRGAFFANRVTLADMRVNGKKVDDKLKNFVRWWRRNIRDDMPYCTGNEIRERSNHTIFG